VEAARGVTTDQRSVAGAEDSTQAQHQRRRSNAVVGNARSRLESWLRAPLRLVELVVIRAVPTAGPAIVEELTRSLDHVSERLEALVLSHDSMNSAIASLTTLVCTLDLTSRAPASSGLEDQFDQLLALQQRTNDLLELVLAAFATPRQAG
jgi:hypothetical protein